MEYIIGNDDERANTATEAAAAARRLGLPMSEVRTLSQHLERTVPKPGTAVMHGKAGTVSDVAKARMNGQQAGLDALAQMSGAPEWAVTDTVREWGSRVNGWGTKNYTAEGEGLAALPDASPSFFAVAKQVAEEKRKAVPFNLANTRLKLGNDGVLRLTIEGKPGQLPITQQLLSSLTSYHPEVWGTVQGGLIAHHKAGGLDPDHKVEVYNRIVTDRLPGHLTQLQRGAPKGARRNSTYRYGSASLWQRQQQGSWQAFHVSGRKHSSHNMDGGKFAQVMGQALKDRGYHGEVKYDPATTRLEFSVHRMPNIIVDLAAGDIFKDGLSGGTNDINEGGYTVDVEVFRNLCHNLIIIAIEASKVYSATHNTNPAKVARELPAAVARAERLTAEVMGYIKPLRIEAPELEGGDREKVSKVLYGYAKQAGIGNFKGGTAQQATTEGLMRAWDKEPGTTYMDVLNALTRVHEDREFMAGLDAFNLSRQAGQLVPILRKKADAVRSQLRTF